MRISVEFASTATEQVFLEWLALQLDRPDIAVVTIAFEDADEPANIAAFVQGIGDEVGDGR